MSLKLYFLFALLTMINSNYLLGQNCPSYLDTRFNPLLVVEMRSTLNLDEITKCYSTGTEYDEYELYFLKGTYYTNECIDSSKYYYGKLLENCLANDIDGDQLGFALFLSGLIRKINNESELSGLYFEAASRKSHSAILKEVSNIYLNNSKGKNLRYSQELKFAKDYDEKSIPKEDYYTLYLAINGISKKRLRILEDAYANISDIDSRYLRIRVLAKYARELLISYSNIDIQTFNNKVTESLGFDVSSSKKNFFYDDYLKYVLENLKRNYFESNQIVQDMIDERNIDIDDILNEDYFLQSNSLDEYLIFTYARSLLFLTREGMGLEPVKRAYNLYIDIFKNRHNEISTNFLLQRSTSKNRNSLDNLLIIANYLSEKTGDTEYISRAWSALNSINSSILNWNILSNRLIRRGDALASVIRENRERKKDIFAMTEAWRKDYAPAKLVDIVEAYDRYYEMGDYIIEQVNARGLADEAVDITERLAQIQRNDLTDSTSILLFNTGAHKHCLLINQDTIIQKNLLRFIREDHLLDDFRNRAGDPTQLPDELGYRIYTTFLSGLKPYLNERVAIISGDEFETFPFVALPTDSTDQPAYLGDEHVFTYHHSLKTFQDDQKENNFSGQDGILALAPKFNTTVQYASRRTTDGTEDLFLTPLRYNILEVKGLEDEYAGDFYVGDEADKEKFLRLAPSRRVIHLATHAVADIGDGEQSALFLDYPDADGSLEGQSLKAGEIGNLILDADLVTLSACETGLGTQLLTEGTVGLTRAFTSAGARSILSTLWAVDDQATSEIVMDFYQQLSTGKAKSTALAAAQQNFRTKHAGTEKDHPYYWAPFILVGSGAPLTDLAADPLPWFWIIVALFLVVSLPVLWLRAQKSTAA